VTLKDEESTVLFLAFKLYNTSELANVARTTDEK
jgi:hypothetical protein